MLMSRPLVVFLKPLCVGSHVHEEYGSIKFLTYMLFGYDRFFNSISATDRRTVIVAACLVSRAGLGLCSPVRRGRCPQARNRYDDRDLRGNGVEVRRGGGQ